MASMAATSTGMLIPRHFLPSPSVYRSQFNPMRLLLKRSPQQHLSTALHPPPISRSRPCKLPRKKIAEQLRYLTSPPSDSSHTAKITSVLASSKAQLSSALITLRSTPLREHFRNFNWRWFFQLSGGYVKQHNWKSWLRFHGVILFKVLILQFVLLWCARLFAWAVFHLYYEYYYPTPECFTDNTRQVMHWMSYERNDLPVAAVVGKRVVQELEKEMQDKGGIDKVSEAWRRDFSRCLVTIGDLQLKVGQEALAAAIYNNALQLGVFLDDPEKLSLTYISLGNCYTGLDQKDAAQVAYSSAIEHAARSVGLELDRENPVLPPNSPPPSPALVSAILALATHYTANAGPAVALPIFASLSRALPPGRDICTEATVMAYLGEVLYALNKRDEGLGWTTKALDIAELEGGGKKECVDCAYYAVGNAITMRKEMGGNRNDWEDEVSSLRRRKRLLSRFGFKER